MNNETEEKLEIEERIERLELAMRSAEARGSVAMQTARDQRDLVERIVTLERAVGAADAFTETIARIGKAHEAHRRDLIQQREGLLVLAMAISEILHGAAPGSPLYKLRAKIQEVTDLEKLARQEPPADSGTGTGS